MTRGTEKGHTWLALLAGRGGHSKRAISNLQIWPDFGTGEYGRAACYDYQASGASRNELSAPCTCEPRSAAACICQDTLRKAAGTARAFFAHTYVRRGIRRSFCQQHLYSERTPPGAVVQQHRRLRCRHVPVRTAGVRSGRSVLAL